jgi:hypothetical protein
VPTAIGVLLACHQIGANYDRELARLRGEVRFCAKKL